MPEWPARSSEPALYLTVLGVFALGLGAIIRNTAGAITAFAGILFVLPGIMHVLPTSWNDAVSPYLPSNAGQQIMSIGPGPARALALGGIRGLLRLHRGRDGHRRAC